MTWYGSVQNRIYERVVSPEPVVGMGCTECLWSDRHPYEVIDVKDARHCTVRELKAKVISGHVYDGSAEYEYESDPNGIVKTRFKTKNGRWVERVGRSWAGSNGWRMGYAEEYYDPSF